MALKTDGGDAVTYPSYYTLICTHSPFEHGAPNTDCEIYWGTKEEMTARYEEIVEDETCAYCNVILTRMVMEAQLTYEHISYGDDE